MNARIRGVDERDCSELFTPKVWNRENLPKNPMKEICDQLVGMTIDDAVRLGDDVRIHVEVIRRDGKMPSSFTLQSRGGTALVEVRGRMVIAAFDGRDGIPNWNNTEIQV
jgi:hypothetical protein